FEYIGEQMKKIDPRSFHLSKTFFHCLPTDLAGLAGVETDIRLEGDHIWLRIARLEADSPPKIEHEAELLQIGNDPFGSLPSLNESALHYRVSELSQGKSDLERQRIETELRDLTATALEHYTKLWKSWAEGEKPRRKTISLYADLFSRKHQMEAEETAKPSEL